MKFSAAVVSGSGRGKGLNVPTINLLMADVPTGIAEGLYACRIDGSQPAVLHYGARPTFNDVPSCEVHLLDVIIDTPPKKLTVEIVQQLRETKKFDSKEELMEQMQRDIVAARAILGV